MFIENTDARAVIRYFNSVNPEFKEKIADWKKGMPVELNKIYKHVDSFHYPIAIWSDFENMSKVRMERIFKRINLMPHEFFLYQYKNRYRIGWKVRNTIV